MSSKDCRHQRYSRINFKKRDNKRELNCRLAHCTQRIEQTFKSIFGDSDSLNDRKWLLNTAEKLEMINENKKVPKNLRKARNFFKETPTTPIPPPIPVP